jgi:hypothetical protein
MKRRCVWILLVLAMAAAARGREYDFRIFSYDEVNKLRQSSPVQRIKIYEGVLDRYGTDIQHSVQMLNYKRMATLAADLEAVMDYVLEDIRACAANEKLRNNKQLRKFEIFLREQISLLTGIQRALPLAWREKLDPPLRKMVYGRRQLFNFINRLDQEGT